MDTPRHLFAKRFYSSAKRAWVDLDQEDLRDHLTELYSDHPLCIYRNSEGKSLSTISQPSLVLYMLDLLELEPGHHVFELGGGSGWNAALLARMVGPTGKVISLEIIDALVPAAQAALKELKLDQVVFESGDANLHAQDKRFDRGVFTASAWELPAAFFHHIKADGLLLFVLKAQPNYDLLCLLRKKSDTHFASELHFSCSFVPVTGSSRHPQLKPALASEIKATLAEENLTWSDIKIPDTLIPEFIEFAKLVFDCQQTFLVESPGLDFDEEFWAIADPKERSVLLFNEDRLQLYGDETKLIALRRAAKRWQKAGQPSIEELDLSLFLSGRTPEPTNDQWLVQRGSSAILWGL